MTRNLKLKTKSQTLADFEIKVFNSFHKPILLDSSDNRSKTIAEVNKSKTAYDAGVVVREFNSSYIKRMNPWLPNDSSSYLEHFIMRVIYAKGEAGLLAVELLNAFTAETDGTLRYGDFVEKNHDRLLKSVRKIQFTSNPDLPSFFKEDINFIFFQRLNASESVNKELNDLTLDEVKQTLKTLNFGKNVFATTNEYDSSNKDLNRRILAVVKGEGKSLKHPSKKHVSGHYALIFTKVLANSSHTVAANLSEYTQFFTTEMSRTLLKAYDNSRLASNRLHSTTDLMLFEAWLRENFQAFTPLEIIALIHALNNNSAVINSASNEATALKLYLKAIDSPTANTVELIKVFAEIIIAWRKALPNATEWFEAIDSKLIDDAFSAELAITLVGSENSITPPTLLMSRFRNRIRTVDVN